MEREVLRWPFGNRDRNCHPGHPGFTIHHQKDQTTEPVCYSNRPRKFIAQSRSQRKRRDRRIGRTFNRMAGELEKIIQGNKELTANISHELRSPLTRIRLAEEMLREKLHQENLNLTSSHLNDIRDDIEEMDRLIGRILELSKLDLQQTPLNFENLDPSQLIKDLLPRFQPAISRKNLILTHDLLFNPPFRGDPEALQTAFSNLLDNAVKFTPEGGEIRIKMESDQEGLRIQFLNTADPFSKEDLPGSLTHFSGRNELLKAGLVWGWPLQKRSSKSMEA